MRGITVLTLLAVIGLLATAPIWAQEKTELDRLRAEFEQLKKDVAQSMDRLDSGVQIHGFVSQGYMRSSDNNYLADSDEGSFDFSEVGINLRTDLSDSLSVGIQFVGRDLGETGNNEVRIDWAYGDYNVAEWFGVRAGRVKIPVGMYGEERDVDAVRIPILLPQGFYPEPFRDITQAINGISFYGNVPLAGLGALDYNFYVGGMDFDHDDNGLRRVQESFRPVEITDMDVDSVLGGSLTWETPIDGLKLNATYLQLNDFSSVGQSLIPGPPTTTYSNNSRFTITTYGAEYVWNKLTLAGEYQIQRGSNYSRTVTTVPFLSVSESRRPNHQMSYYLMATYQLTEKVALGTYYSMYFLDKKDRDGDNFSSIPAPAGPLPRFLGQQRDVAVFTKLDLTPQWSLKAEYHWMKGAAMLLSTENTNEAGVLQLEEDWQMLLLKMTFTF